MSAISSKALLKTADPYRYNAGSELEEELDYYNTFYRKYDAQIGRFTGVDILAEGTVGLSPFQFGNNNPVMFNDPTGAKSDLPPGTPQFIVNMWNFTPDKKDYIFINQSQFGFNNETENGGGPAAITFEGFEISSNTKGTNQFGVKGSWMHWSSNDNIGNGTSLTNVNIGSKFVQGYSSPMQYNRLDANTSESDYSTTLSAFDFGMGIYSEYIYNHKTYETTNGIEKNIYKANGSVRSARAAKFANASRFIKGVAFVGSAVSTAYSASKIYNQIQADQKVNGWDVADFSVGMVGLGSSSVLLLGLVSNPVGIAILGAVGTGALIYGGVRLAYDLIKNN